MRSLSKSRENRLARIRYKKGGSRLREIKRLAASKRRFEKPDAARKNVFDYYHRDLEKKRLQCRERRKRSLEKYQKAARIRAAKRYKKNPGVRLRSLFSNRIFYALRKTRTVKSIQTMKLLGCTIEELRGWLESNFKPGMTWENYGPVWHVDHKRPCAWFDLTDPLQQRVCFHWTNLQPLFARENIRKGAK